MNKHSLRIETLPTHARRGLRWLRAASDGSLRKAALTYCALLVFIAPAAPPPAGQQIGNQASATYTDASNTPRTATSNVAITTVQQVSAFTLTTDGQAKFAAPGGQVSYPYTLVNTGNGLDTFNLSAANNAAGDNFDLSSLTLYADANGDGLPDNNTALTGTGPLAAGDTFKFVAIGTVPGGASASQTAVLTVTASGTATATPAAAQINSATTTVTANAVVNVTKAISSSSGNAGSGPYTITLTYNNTGNNTATNVTLLDVLPAGMTYVAGSARWSVTGSGVALTDATGDSQGTAPDTMTYDYNVSAAGRVTAVISRVQPGETRTVTFQVNIAAAQSTGTIQNTASYTYDPGTGTAIGPFVSNTADFDVNQTAGLSLTGSTVAGATQGGTVSFTNVVQNTGNGVDSFDLTMANTSFPAGTTFTLYQSDGNTPMVDNNGNSTPDTGNLAPGASYNVVLKAVLPTGVSGANVNYTVAKTATSRANSATNATVNDVLTSVTANSVDLQAAAGAGAGQGPEASAVQSLTGNPGVTTRFTLVVTNTSGVADTYDLSYATNAAFSTANLPTGWTIVFRDTSEAIVTGTGVLLAGGTKTIYADVTTPATQTPGTTDLYYRIVSPTSGANDRLHDALTVNTVRSLALTPNNSGQVYPGGTVVYSHLLANNGNVLEGSGAGSTIALNTAQSLSGWSAVTYYDANNNGVIDGSDTVVTNLAFVSAGTAGLAPGETVRLLVKISAPPGAPLGAVNATTFTATTANGSYTSTGPTAVSAADNTTVISGDLRLTKEQALDSNLDGAPDGAYSAAEISTGAFPGKSVRYRITVVNNGTAPATSVKVFDTTPAYTLYTSTGPAATTVGSVTTVPANNTVGSLEFNLGTLNPGQSAVITFGVTIQQ